MYAPELSIIHFGRQRYASPVSTAAVCMRALTSNMQVSSSQLAPGAKKLKLQGQGARAFRSNSGPATVWHAELAAAKNKTHCKPEGKL